MILSGMSNQEQLEKNLKTFKTDQKLNEEEMQLARELEGYLDNIDKNSR